MVILFFFCTVDFTKTVLDVVNVFKIIIDIVKNGDFNDIPNGINNIINDKYNCNL